MLAKPPEGLPSIAVATACSGARSAAEIPPRARGMIGPLRAQLIAECEVMLQHALSAGQDLPPTVVDALDVLDRENEESVGLPVLADLHRLLARAVSPATPGGLALIQEDLRNHRTLHAFGPVPSVRYLLVAALGFSLLFFTISLSPDINPVAVGRDIFNSSGLQLASVLVFLL